MTVAEPPALPKQEGSASKYYVIYLIYFAFALIPATTCLMFFLTIVPTFKEIFMDFKTTLPSLTENMMALANLVHDGGWIVIVLAALIAPIWPARWTARQPVRASRFNQMFLAFNIMFLLNLIIACTAALALYLPLVKLVQSVSGHDSGGEY